MKSGRKDGAEELMAMWKREYELEKQAAGRPVDPDEEMIVIFDDISLEPGRIRIRKKGSAGGHNGIKSIIAMTGTQGFSRIKVGVGEKPQGWDLADHVLGRFSSEDRAKVEEAIGHAMDAAVLMMQGETDKAMNIYN